MPLFRKKLIKKCIYPSVILRMTSPLSGETRLAVPEREGGGEAVGRVKKSLSVKRGIGILIVSYATFAFLVHSEDSLEEEYDFEEEAHNAAFVAVAGATFCAVEAAGAFCILVAE